ncbi:hypothetical protein CBR_g52195 [Chara braunii]|uniref:Uncharacterized protein n=1 Tax=Chara braunii TaxID=69332 RepID=A0A388MA21_CHABU|nr:hypothetical protein CBR_g52195 [Chara braunii]|eukprot:GBG91309.1 hypothetical protein CBR_g52195 [Chara braunii]
MQARNSTSCTMTICWSFECFSTHSKRHRLVALTGVCRNLRRAVSIREGVEEETKETAEVTEEMAHNLPEKGSGETSSGEKASSGKGSGGKGSDGKGSVGKGSGGKGSGGKGSGRKGSGRKRRMSGSPQYRETDSQCVGSRDSDMRDVATLRSNQVRVDSLLSARTLFPDADDSLSRRAQQRSPVHNTLLLEEGERLQHTATSPERGNHSLIGTASSFCLEGGMPALRRSEGATASSLSSGERHKLRIDSELLTSPLRPSARSAPHATFPRGQENVTSCRPHLQLGTRFPCSAPFSYVETRDWRSRDVLEGPVAGVLETGGGDYERHASESVSVDVDSKSTAAPREEERSPGAHAVQREEETQQWQSRKVLETGGSEYERHVSEGASVDTDSKSTAAPGEMHTLQREEETQHWPAREVVKGLDARVLLIGTSEEVLHSRSAVATTREGVVKVGQWTFVEARLLGDEEGKEEPVVEARVHGDEKGGEPVVEGGEVMVGIHMRFCTVVRLWPQRERVSVREVSGRSWKLTFLAMRKAKKNPWWKLGFMAMRKAENPWWKAVR